MKSTNRFLQRIKSQKEISNLFRCGKYWKNSLFTIIFVLNNRQFDRMAVLVSKKNGIAVVRNRIKRIAREVFFNSIVAGPPFYDILICPRYSSSEKLKRLKEKYETWRSSIKK